MFSYNTFALFINVTRLSLYIISNILSICSYSSDFSFNNIAFFTLPPHACKYESLIFSIFNLFNTNLISSSDNKLKYIFVHLDFIVVKILFSFDVIKIIVI